MSKRNQIGLAVLSALVVVAMAGLMSCSTVPEPATIPKDLSAEQLMQRAQEAHGENEYETAMVYYKLILERYPMEKALLAEVDYNKAFILYKQNKDKEAQAAFAVLLAQYEGPDAAILPTFIPPLVKKLQKLMEIRAMAKASPSPAPASVPSPAQ